MSLRRFVSRGPSRQDEFRYERADGEFRVISVPTGFGRFRRGNEEAARELAERRLAEQFGDMAFVLEEQKRQVIEGFVDPGAERLRQRPDLHQDNYSFVGVRRTK